MQLGSSFGLKSVPIATIKGCFDGCRTVWGGVKLRFPFAYVLLFHVPLVSFIWISRSYQNGIEYYFGANLMILYALTTFVYISQIQIPQSKTIAELSSCFLPVYVTHLFVIAFVQKIMVVLALGTLSIYVEYLLVASITLIFSWLIMKIPYMDKIFKI